MLFDCGNVEVSAMVSSTGSEYEASRSPISVQTGLALVSNFLPKTLRLLYPCLISSQQRFQHIHRMSVAPQPFPLII